MVVAPVLVTVEAPRTAKLSAEPSTGTVVANPGAAAKRNTATPVVNRINRLLFILLLLLRASKFLARRTRLGTSDSKYSAVHTRKRIEAGNISSRLLLSA